MVVCYVAIFCAAYMNSKKPVRLERYLQNSKGKLLYNRMSKIKHRTLKQVVKDHKSDIKVASTVSIVIATFVASWLPSFIAEMTYFRTVEPAKLINSYSFTSHVVFWMIYISPTLNPIIYAMHNTTIRRMVFIMIRDRKLQRSSTSNILGTTILDPSRRSSVPTVSDLDVVKKMNPAQPFRRRASSVIGLLKIHKTLQRAEDEDVREEVIHEQDELVSEYIDGSTVSSIGRDTDEVEEEEGEDKVDEIVEVEEIVEVKPKKRVSISTECPAIHVPEHHK